MQRVWLDTEFIRNNFSPRGLISIGLTSESGKEYYAVNWLLDSTMFGLGLESYKWMCENVWPHLPGGHPEKFDRDHPEVKEYATIREDIERFFWDLTPDGNPDRDITIYVNCGAQDMIRLHTLWDNDWGVMPSCVPKFADDMARIKRESVLKKEALPKQNPKTEHHALYDAQHDKKTYVFIKKYQEAAAK